MKLENFLEIANQFFAEAGRLLKTKNWDYAGKEVFENFTKQSALCSVLELDVSKEEHWILAQIVEKLVRLRNLEGKEPKHDSVRDSCMDIVNFAVLYYGITMEKKDG